MVDEEDKTDMR